MKYLREICFLLLIFIALASCREQADGTLIYIEPDKENGFYWPYYLFIPEDVDTVNLIYLVIEPNNSGFASDELEPHRENAERTATKDFYLGNFVARNMNFPLLVPVFPRSESQWQIYTHALDRDVMQQKENELERIDLQLINMIDHACKKLAGEGITVHEKFLMTGFSASGSFVNRFAFLHPDKVEALAAGGVNGLLMLPLDSAGKEALHYPLGIAGIEEYCKSGFRSEDFKMLPQFYFMGENDTNDAIPYDDAYDNNERELIYRHMGRQMQPDRWEFCQGIYMDQDVNVKFRTYPDVGHEHPELVKNEVVHFFRDALENAK